MLERADSLDNLLWYSLQDAVSLADANSVFLYAAKVITLKEGSHFTLKAELYGTPRTPKTLGFEIKAVSRYNLGIVRDGGTYHCNVVVDV